MIASASSANRGVACSVVIPAFNVEHHIGGAIDSLLRQRTTAPFEIIVVDDGSTDGTAAIVRSYGNRVRLLSKPNGGPATARNLGVREASSEIIHFLDADDRALPGRIEQPTQCLLDCPDIALCFGNAAFEDDSSDHLQGFGLVGDPAAFSRLAEPLAKLLLSGDFVATPACAVRRRAYMSCGMQPEELRYAEDYALWCRIAASGAGFAFTQAPLAWICRSRPGRLTTSVHTYLGPVMVLHENLQQRGHLLRADEYRRVMLRFLKLTEVLLRHEWASSGRASVLARMATLSPLLPSSLIRKWALLSLIPSFIPRGARDALRGARRLLAPAVVRRPARLLREKRGPQPFAQ